MHNYICVRRPGQSPPAASPTAAPPQHAAQQAAHAQSHEALLRSSPQQVHQHYQASQQLQQRQVHQHQQQQHLQQGHGQVSQAAAQTPQGASRIVASLPPAQQQVVVRAYQYCVRPAGNAVYTVPLSDESIATHKVGQGFYV